MSDPGRPEGFEPTQPAGWETTQPLGNGYPPYPDPAYAGQSPYWSTYVPPSAPNPTEPMPQYWQQGQYPPDGPPLETPPPGPPKSPRWLWILAAAAVLLVVGLVIALMIANGSSNQATVVAPLTTVPEATSTRAPTPTTTPSRSPIPTTSTAPTMTITPPLAPSAPGATETVVYNVTGQGRAINITYVDTGGVMQTEFNVVLPWSKEVSLSTPARDAASVVIINVGRDVTCTVTVNGVQVRERTGAGLTICSGVG